MPYERIRKIQQSYVELIENHFADERRHLGKTDLSYYTHSDLRYLRSRPNLLVPGKHGWQRSLDKKMADMVGDVERFWKENGPELLQSLASEDYLGACLWGEMGTDTLIPKFGLYFDTIAIGDPTPWAPDSHAVKNIEAYASGFIGWTTLMELVKPAIYADLDWPMVIIYPTPYFPGSVENADLVRAVNIQGMRLAEQFLRRVFQLPREFDGPYDFSEILLHIPLDKVNAMFDSHRLSDLLNYQLNIGREADQLSRVGHDVDLLHRISSHTLHRHDFVMIFNLCATMFSLLMLREENSRLIGADNTVLERLTPALLQRNEIVGDEMKAQLNLDEEAVVSYSFIKRFQWLSNVSIEDCARLREKERFQEVRDLFRIERRKLKRSTIDDYERLSVDLERSVRDTLDRAVQDAEASMPLTRKQTRNMYISLGITLALGVASLAFPALRPLAIASTAFTTLYGGASLKRVVDHHLTNKKRIAELGERPISFILRAYQQRNREDDTSESDRE